MSDDILIRKTGRVGHITLNRPDALNALTYQMCLDIEAALDAWALDDALSMVLIDGAGERAFCAGGDIQEMYRTAKAGDFGYGRRFWADEYRLNAKIAHYPKPFVAFMHGFTMGGGVGVSAHGSQRVVCESSVIAMPECGIGLVPDVGGTVLLACAPGRVGEYLGSTGARMSAGCAIYAGFADSYVPFDSWDDLRDRLMNEGDPAAIDDMSEAPPPSVIADQTPDIDACFGGETLRDIVNALKHRDDEWATKALKALSRQSPLSASCAIELVHRARGLKSMTSVLAQEYRFTYRSASDGDFVEGIRAQIIDKDRNPTWRHASIDKVSGVDVANMLKPLGEYELRL